MKIKRGNLTITEIGDVSGLAVETFPSGNVRLTLPTDTFITLTTATLDELIEALQRARAELAYDEPAGISVENGRTFTEGPIPENVIQVKDADGDIWKREPDSTWTLHPDGESPSALYCEHTDSQLIRKYGPVTVERIRG